MSKRVVFWSLVAISCVFLCAGAAPADTISVTGAFTSFSGVIVGGGATFFSFCPSESCVVIGPPTPPVATCPDAGCGTAAGIAHTSFGGIPTDDKTSRLSFLVFANPKNELIFRSVGLTSFASEFKLGTLTFTNGAWSDNADFGFSIVAENLTTHKSARFDGFIHLVLTPNTGTPEANADFIYLTDAAGDPVASPLTLSTLPSIRAYELADSPTGSNSVTVQLFGRFGSLALTRVDHPTEGGFLDVSLTADLGGPPPAVPEPPAAVPRPGTWALLASGALAIAALTVRPRRSKW